MSNLVNTTTSSRSKSMIISLGVKKTGPSKRKRMSVSLSAGDGARSHAAEADRLSTPRRIILAGAVEGEGLFDGSDDMVIYTTGEMERDYRWLKNKPRINGVELTSDKSSEDLGVQPAGEYADTEITNSEVDDIIDNASNVGEEPEDDEAMTSDDIDNILNG